jgi:hypothetical protein
MRFDKRIWDPGCKEYLGGTGVLDTSYFNEATKIVLSVWLERLTDLNAPVTRRLASLCLLDLVDELLRSIEIWGENDRTAYRMLLLVKEVDVSLKRGKNASLEHPGQEEASRLQQFGQQFADFVRASNKEKDALWPPLAARLGKSPAFNGGHPETLKIVTRELVSITTGLRGFLRGDDAYLRCLIHAFSACLTSGTINDLERIDHVVCELLAFSLRRGYSREQLAELPIKYLRADNANLAGKPLSDRLALLLGAFRPSKQRYTVVLPLVGPRLVVDGDIFPKGIELLEPEGWNKALPGPALAAVDASVRELQAFRVDVDDVRAYEAAEGSWRPHDVFAARDVAVKAVRRCLDVVFLLRAAVPTVAGCALVAASELGKDVFVRQLDLERDHRPERVSLKFLRAVPAEWVDALHWYREGREDPSDEVGIVNLWTALELLSRRDIDAYHSDADRVVKTIGTLATLGLFERELRYLGREVATFLNIKCDDSREVFRAWVLEKKPDEIGATFAGFPHLAALVTSAASGQYFRRRAAEVEMFVSDKLVWAYGYRNDVVHEGRRGLPGASTARFVLAEIAESAIALTLRLESRRFTSSLSECFLWGREQLLTVKELAAAGKVAELLGRAAI